MKKRVLFLFLLLIPFLLISLFNHPSLDDYWNANTILSHGRLGAIPYSFNHFSGRYFSTFLMCILNTLPQGGIWIFKLFPVFICAGLVGALYYFIKKVFQPESNWTALACALALTLLHILNMRVLYEGLYWMSATVTYQVGILIYITLTALIFSYVSSRCFPKMLGICILTICLSGTAESLEPLFLATLIFLHFKFKKEKKIHKYSIIMFCLMLNLLCLGFVLVSNGTHSRISMGLSQFHIPAGLALWRALESVGYYYASWLFSPYNILAAFIFISLAKSSPSASRSAFSGNIPGIILRIVFISALTGMMVYFPGLYLESSLPAPRITTLVFMIFCFSVAGALIAAAGLLNPVVSFLQRRMISNLLWITFFLSVLLSNNFLKVSSDLLSGTAFRFNQEQNKRYSDLRNCPADTCYIDSLKNWPASIERNPREKSISNPMLYWDTYFNKKRIIIK